MKLNKTRAEKTTSLALKPVLNPAIYNAVAANYASHKPIERKRRFFKKIGRFFKKGFRKVKKFFKKINPIDAIKRAAKKFIIKRIIKVLYKVDKALSKAIKGLISKLHYRMRRLRG